MSAANTAEEVVSAAVEAPKWTLYYHDAPMKGRGEYIRIIFEAAQVPFKEVGDFPSLKAKCDSFNYPGTQI